MKIIRWYDSIAILCATTMLLAGCGGGGGGSSGGGSGGYSISGKTTDNGAVLSGVTVALSGDKTDSAMSDAVGNYSFSGLAGGIYGVTPSKTGYTFNPVSTGFNPLNQNIAGLNWDGYKIYSVSGMVTFGGVGLSGVAISSSPFVQWTQTDSNGSYTLSGLPEGGPFYITPSKSGYTFSPNSSIAQWVSGQNITGVNFTATSTGPAPGTLTIFNASSNQIDQAFTRLSSSSSWGLPWNGSSLSPGLSWSRSLTSGTYDNQVASIGAVSTYYAYDLAYSITSGSTHSFIVSDQDFTGTLLINNLNTTYPITAAYVSATTFGGGSNHLSTNIAPSSSRQIVGLLSGTYYVRVIQNGVNIDSTATVVSHSYTTITIN